MRAVNGWSVPRLVPGVVELGGGLGVGVGVEQAVEQLDCVGVGLAGLPGPERDRGAEAERLAAAEADVQVDLVGAVEGDVLDQQPRDALALARRGGRVGPEFREVGGERADLGLVLVGEEDVRIVVELQRRPPVS
jgi:hypothetical protein